MPKRAVVPNAERKAATRKAVIDAAAHCFDEWGYLATRLDDVTERAHLTKGAVYFHFGSKEALAHALIDEQRRQWPAVVDDVVSRAGTPLDQVVQLTYEVIRELRDDVVIRAGVRLALDQDVPGVDPSDLVASWTSVFEEQLKRARRSRTLSPDVTPAAAARVVVAFLLGAHHVAGIDDGVDARRRLDEFWSLVLPRFQP